MEKRIPLNQWEMLVILSQKLACCYVWLLGTKLFFNIMQFYTWPKPTYSWSQIPRIESENFHHHRQDVIRGGSITAELEETKSGQECWRTDLLKKRANQPSNSRDLNHVTFIVSCQCKIFSFSRNKLFAVSPFQNVPLSAPPLVNIGMGEVACYANVAPPDTFAPQLRAYGEKKTSTPKPFFYYLTTHDNENVKW